MWFPVDNGMVNLDRVAYIRVQEDLEVSFYNDHRAEMTSATFETEEHLRTYLAKLKGELDFPSVEYDPDRFPHGQDEPLLEAEEAEREES